MSPVDIIFTLVLGVALLRGYAKGLLGTAATYAAPVVAFMVAADWSEPVRAWLATTETIPEFFLEFLAPVLVFIGVVIVVRLAVALLAGVLGIDRMLPSKILGAGLGLAVSAVVLGAVVLLVHELRPKERVRIEGDAGEVLTDPLERTVVDIDRRFGESLLGPPLAHFTSTIIARAMNREPGQPLLSDGKAAPILEPLENATKRAAEAAADAIVNPKGGAPERDEPEANTKADAKPSPPAEPRAPDAKPTSPEAKPSDAKPASSEAKGSDAKPARTATPAKPAPAAPSTKATPAASPKAAPAAARAE